ncbi:MAG: DUF5336 domain-containing protein [Trueperaceae bacterium]|nr:DUF5336 domain-containing protein [Trueperaceae bacterium]
MNQTTQQNQIIGLVLIALGALLWLARASNFSVGAVLWPLFILVPGGALLVVALNDPQRNNLAVPGSLLSVLGLIFLFQSITGYFESWAYIWALIPASIGAGRALQGHLSGNTKLVRKGEIAARNWLIGLAAFFIFFEVIIGIGGRGVFSNLLFPLLLIGAGLYLLSRNQESAAETTPPGSSDTSPPQLETSPEQTETDRDNPDTTDPDTANLDTTDSTPRSEPSS